MNERPFAGIAAAMLIAPLVILCCAGPAVVGSILGAIVAWLGGLTAIDVMGVALAIGVVAYGLLRWSKVRARGTAMQQAHGHSEPASAPMTDAEMPPRTFDAIQRGPASQDRVRGEKLPS